MATRIGKDGTIIRDSSDQYRSNVWTNTPIYQHQSNNPSSLGFYIITLVISAIVSWVLSGLVSVFVFNPNKAAGWLSGVTVFINNLSPYLIFLAGIGGCFWYNVKHSFYFGVSEILLSALSAVVACLIAGVALLLLSWTIKVIVIIIIAIVAISIFFGG